MFNEGAMSDLTDIIFIFNFSPHTVKHAKGNCVH
jgi:hypothetical protein